MLSGYYGDTSDLEARYGLKTNGESNILCEFAFPDLISTMVREVQKDIHGR